MTTLDNFEYVRRRWRTIASLTVLIGVAAPAAGAELHTAYQNRDLNIEIDRYDATGALKDGKYLTVAGDFRSPIGFKGFAYDPGNTLWTAYENGDLNIEVDRYDPTGALADGKYLTVAGDFRSPIGFGGFAFDPGGNLWTAYQNGDLNIEIDRYDPTGALTDGKYLTVAGDFSSPIGFEGFAFDPGGNLWTAYRNGDLNIEIDRYDATGALSGGKYLTVAGDFRSPIGFEGFAFDPGGNLWTAYQNGDLNIEIDRYNATGALAGGEYLTVAGDFRSPIGFKGFAFAPGREAISTVPEPDGWAMMVIGFAIAGIGLRAHPEKRSFLLAIV